MTFVVAFLIAAVMVVLYLLGHLSWIIALPAIGIVVAVMLGYAMRNRTVSRN